MRSKIRGGKRVRRLMKSLPDAMRGQLVNVLRNGGRALVSSMRARAPSRTGALRAGIQSRVYEKTLRLRVGLIGTPGGRAKLFYGRIQDLGRKGREVVVQRRRRVTVNIGAGEVVGVLRTQRGRKVGSDIVSTYRMRVRPMAPKRFITGRYPELRTAIGNALRGIWARALRSIASGHDE